MAGEGVEANWHTMTEDVLSGAGGSRRVQHPQRRRPCARLSRRWMSGWRGYGRGWCRIEERCGVAQRG